MRQTTDAARRVRAETGRMSTAAKKFEFPVAVEWLEGRLTRASVAGKPDLEVATPPEFKHGIAGVWSPEDLLVGSVASCFEVTLLAVAERRDVPLRQLDVAGNGTVTQRADGRFGFTEVVLAVRLHTDPGREADAAACVEAAELGCLVAASVDFPIRVELDLRTVVPELVQ
jgi:organic hydroperoxide reductase OsmC/OhrA